MDLFIDKANLVSFLSMQEKIDRKNVDSYLDCRRLMDRQLHICCNFPMPDILDDYGNGAGWTEDVPDDSKVLKAYFNDYEGGGMENESEVEFVDQKEVFDEKCSESKFKICLLDITESHNITIDNVIVGYVGEEFSKLKQLFCGKDYDLHKLYDLQKFTDWRQLGEDGHCLPTQDVIIFDRYLFSSFRRSDGVLSYKLTLVQKNFQKLCSQLIQACTKDVNIIVLTLSKDEDVGSFSWLRKKIHDELKMKGLNVFLSFVLIPDNKDKNILAPHDRTILTNYRLFSSGDSFNYFGKDNKIITQGKRLDVDSLAKFEVTNFAHSFIDEMSELYKNVKKYGETCNIKNIIGSSRSNLLNIEQDNKPKIEEKTSYTMEDLLSKFNAK